MSKKYKKPRLTPRHDEALATDLMIPPALRFSPTAWAKLLMFCHAGDTEIGGFGITSAHDPLRIEDFLTIRQTVSIVTVSFEDDAVAEFFDAQVDAGRRPEQFGRIWLHTHPGISAEPSTTDERTFSRVFGDCNWAVMFILAKGGATYARLRFNIPSTGQMRLPVEVEFNTPFPASDFEAWRSEYEQNILPEPQAAPAAPAIHQLAAAADPFEGLPGYAWDADNLMDHVEQMDVLERDRFWDEMTSRPDLWGDERSYHEESIR